MGKVKVTLQAQQLLSLVVGEAETYLEVSVQCVAPCNLPCRK